MQDVRQEACGETLRFHQPAFGPHVLGVFGPKLLSLMTILAVERPVSPGASEGGIGTGGSDREDAAGGKRAEPGRIYPDANPKAEIVFALRRVEALVGFL